MKKSDLHYVSSSELAEYIYCECCWWDKREDFVEETEAMRLGTLEHSQVQSSLINLFSIRMIALITVGIGLLLLIIIFLMQFLGII